MSEKVFTENWDKEITEESLKHTQIPMMVKLLGTTDEKGWPHLTFIASSRAKTNKQLVWGQFLHGNSKQYIQDNPKHSYLFMSIDMPFKMLQIKANFTHTLNKSEDLDKLNTGDDMRYSTTMNFFKAFYSDIVAASQLQKISIIKLLKNIFLSKIGKGGIKSNKEEEARLDKFGKVIFTHALNPKFIAYLDPNDDYPIIVPCFQAISHEHTKLVFSPSLFKEQLSIIPTDSKVAVFGMTMDFIAQVVKGTFLGFEKHRGINLGIIDIEEVYNSAPPLPGLIYPKKAVLPEISEFVMP
jgi:hypothetical protein